MKTQQIRFEPYLRSHFLFPGLAPSHFNIRNCLLPPLESVCWLVCACPHKPQKRPHNAKPDAAHADGDQREPSPPRFEPRPLLLLAGARNAAHRPQHKSSRRDALLARQKRGTAVAWLRNQRKGHGENLFNEADRLPSLAGRILTGKAERFSNQNDQRPRLPGRFRFRRRQNLFRQLPKSPPIPAQKPLDDASQNRENDKMNMDRNGRQRL